MNHAVTARGRFAGVGGFASAGHPWASEQPYDEAWGPPDPHGRHGVIHGTLAPWVSTDRYRQDKPKALPRPKADESVPVLCWCESYTLSIPVADVRRGLTGSCGALTCNRERRLPEVVERKAVATRTGKWSVAYLPEPKPEPKPKPASTWLASIEAERARAQCEAEQFAAYRAVLDRWERRLKPIHWKAST